MTLLHLIMWLVLIGVGLMLVNKFVPMEPSIKTILNVVVIVAVVLWVLPLFGFDIPIPQIGGTRHRP